MISPVGSIFAVRFVFNICLRLPLVNNHMRLLLMRLATYYTVIQVLDILYGHVLYGYGTPAFIQHQSP